MIVAAKGEPMLRIKGRKVTLVPKMELSLLYISSAGTQISSLGTCAKTVQAVAESWSAGSACKRKQSLHSRCRLHYVTMDIGLHRSGDGLCILVGVPQALVYKDEGLSLGVSDQIPR